MKKFENLFYKKGFQKIAGLDESGRGCIAGPLVVAICVFDPLYVNKKINDSKKILEKNRYLIFDEIIKDAILVDWVIYDSTYVDMYNPKITSIKGMEYLVNKHKDKVDFCLIDAEKIKTTLPSLSIIKGDQKSQSIAAASIVAKVIRDKMMLDIDLNFPKYDFKNNKGYGTKKHLEALEKYGPIKKIHRFSYKPVIKNIKK